MSDGKFGFNAFAHERTHGWRSFAMRLAICSIVTWALYAMGGIVGALPALMLWAKVFAADLVALGEVVMHQLRRLAHREIEGQHYAFKGQRMRVRDDDSREARRWIAVDDIALALGAPVRVVSLQLRQSGGLRQWPDGWYVHDDAALAYLAERQVERAARLRVWVEREVWYPARGRKASYDEKKAPQAAPADD